MGLKSYPVGGKVQKNRGPEAAQTRRQAASLAKTWLPLPARGAYKDEAPVGAAAVSSGRGFRATEGGGVALLDNPGEQGDRPAGICHVRVRE